MFNTIITFQEINAAATLEERLYLYFKRDQQLELMHWVNQLQATLTALLKACEGVRGDWMASHYLMEDLRNAMYREELHYERVNKVAYPELYAVSIEEVAPKGVDISL